MMPEKKVNKFEYLILKPIYFKSLLPSTIDLLLTNRKQSFLGSEVYEIGISDHREVIISVLRKTIAKGKPKNSF